MFWLTSVWQLSLLTCNLGSQYPNCINTPLPLGFEVQDLSLLFSKLLLIIFTVPPLSNSVRPFPVLSSTLSLCTVTLVQLTKKMPLTNEMFGYLSSEYRKPHEAISISCKVILLASLMYMPAFSTQTILDGLPWMIIKCLLLMLRTALI